MAATHSATVLIVRCRASASGLIIENIVVAPAVRIGSHPLIQLHHTTAAGRRDSRTYNLYKNTYSGAVDPRHNHSLADPGLKWVRFWRKPMNIASTIR